MELTVENFHDIGNLKLRVEADKSLHIAGKSGCGKSGIFEAILWCFYGFTKGVEPRSAQTARVLVSTKFDNGVQITRGKNKKLLLFEIGDACYEGDIAQNKINEYFRCDREGWIATSYVIQEKMHYIFTLPAIDRYNMLLRLSMDGEDAEKRIKKLNEKIKSSKEQYASKNSEYSRLLIDYEALCEKYAVGFKQILSKEKMIIFTDKVEGFKQTLQDLLVELNEAKSCQLQRETFSKTRSRLQKDSSALAFYSEIGLRNLEETLNTQRKVRKLQNEKKLLDQSLTKNELQIKETTPERLIEVPSEKELEDIRHRERLHLDGLSKATKLDVEYSKEAVDVEIQRLEILLSDQERATLAHMAYGKNERLQECVKLLPDEPSTPTAQITKSINSLERDKKGLKSELDVEVKRSIESAKMQLKQDIERLQSGHQSERESITSEITQEREQNTLQSTLESSTLIAEREVAKTELLAMDRSREVHSCPYCLGAIRYVDDQLEKSNQKPFDQSAYDLIEASISSIDVRVETLENNEKQMVKASEAKLASSIAALKKRFAESESVLREACEKKVKLWERNLKKEFGDRIDATSADICRLKEQQKLWKLREELLSEIDSLRSELDVLPEPRLAEKERLSPKQLETSKSRLLQLRSLTFHENPPISYSDYQLIIDHKKNKAQNIQLTSKIAVIQSSLNEFPKVLEKEVTQAEVSTYREQLSTKKTLLSQLQQTENDLSLIKETRLVDELDKEVAKYQRYKAKHEASLSNSKKASILLDRYQKIEELVETCNSINARMIEYERFYVMIKEKIVDSITELIVFTNNYLSEVSKILFDSPISIELSTERHLKSGSKRQEINLLIHYKGGQVYNYDTGLSGGEKARINAMLTLAFARYIDSKILIFDEVVSFLDDIKAQQLMDVVNSKELGVPGRIVLLASQNCSSGLVHETRNYESLGSSDLSA